MSKASKNVENVVFAGDFDQINISKSADDNSVNNSQGNT